MPNTASPNRLWASISVRGWEVLYSQDGLNDTSHAQGCCCCGGNEITNAEEINVNILVYSLLQ